MADFVDSTVKEIDARLSELKQELARLEAARAALVGTRRGGATRANQALELVRGKPGITIPEIAKSMGIAPNYLYRVLPRLQQEGQIKRDGQGWMAASS